MADASRFPQGIVIDVANLSEARPVGTIVCLSTDATLWRSTSPTVATYEPMVSAGIQTGLLTTVRPAGEVVQVENGSTVDGLYYSLSSSVASYAEVRATGYNSGVLPNGSSSSLPNQPISATGLIDVQRYNTIYTVTGTGSITTTLSNSTPQYHGQVLGVEMQANPTATGFVFTTAPAGNTIYDPVNDALGNTLTWAGVGVPGASFALVAYSSTEWTLVTARGFTLS